MSNMKQEQKYTTSKIANIFNIHPNTVRLYEDLGYISAPQRNKSGYRVFTHEHEEQIMIVKTALRAEVLQNGLRKEAIEIIKTVAKRDYPEALRLAKKYQSSIENEKQSAKKAIKIVNEYLDLKVDDSVHLKRKEVAKRLNITIDTLRNWERNGLIKTKRSSNGYRVYNEKDLNMLQIIRELRVANYSLSAILRMINSLNNLKKVDIETILNTPESGEYIVSVCDKLLVSLNGLGQDAIELEKRIRSL